MGPDSAGRRSTRRRLALGAAVIAAAALAFQALHVVEHATQLGNWFAAPRAKPWMTPWATEAVEWLAVGGDHALGMELLHLIGNGIFLTGLVALIAFRAFQGRVLRQSPSLRLATIVQSLHVAEHVALTATVIFAGKAIGVSTFFGLADGAAMTSWRVWFHFLINLIATCITTAALADRTPVTTSDPVHRAGPGGSETHHLSPVSA